MNLEELKKIREKAQKEVELRQKQARIRVVVGMGTSGIAAGARDVLKAFVEEISRRNLSDVIVTQTGGTRPCFAGADGRGL
jgi:type IV pilus biogenesis protein CpaD/CtpE